MTGCAADDPGETSALRQQAKEAAPLPEPMVRDDLTTPIVPNPAIELRPTTPRPGQQVELRFPSADTRGVFFTLERQVGGSWQQTHFLISDQGQLQPSAKPVDEEILITLMAVGGPGPDLVVLPNHLDPGTWRICTLDESNPSCGEFEI